MASLGSKIANNTAMVPFMLFGILAVIVIYSMVKGGAADMVKAEVNQVTS